jgi:hypothetical protein
MGQNWNLSYIQRYSDAIIDAKIIEKLEVRIIR